MDTSKRKENVREIYILRLDLSIRKGAMAEVIVKRNSSPKKSTPHRERTKGVYPGSRIAGISIAAPEAFCHVVAVTLSI